MLMPLRRGERDHPPSAGSRLNAPKQRRGSRRGAAAVEFALVAPLFFILVFTMFEFGRMVMVHQVMTAAAREGARRAILEGATKDDVEAFVENMLDETTLAEATVECSPEELDRLWFGDPVTVTVQVGYSEVSWIASIWVFSDPQMTASCTMSIERPE